MDERQRGLFWLQFKAMLKRNVILKIREKRRTISEILLPMYFLALLIVIKLLLPNPHLSAVTKPRGTENIFKYFTEKNQKRTIAVAPDSLEVREFITNVDGFWNSTNSIQTNIIWTFYGSEGNITNEYNSRTSTFCAAIIFEIEESLFRYKIRTNPYYHSSPSTSSFMSSVSKCRGKRYFIMEDGDTCPANDYYFSGFLALQTIIDYTKIQTDTSVTIRPDLNLEIMPTPAATQDFIIILRYIIPLYMVLALSQFITYLMILIVGEKEKKIKEGMKIMGLEDSVFWLSWFVIYASFVLVLAVVCILLLQFLSVFANTNLIYIFLLILLYGLSVIMFAFMVTPFFDKARTAGILSNFMLVIMSFLYYMQDYISNKDKALLWLISLISPTGFALAMDNALVMDVAGEGVSLSNLWDGRGRIPFGGSLLMLAFDIVLYGLIAYYLDNVIPSEHGVKRSPLFCISPSFWISRKMKAAVNQEPDEFDDNVEPVTLNMRGRKAIQIRHLRKEFKKFRKAPVTAINGINLTIYEGQITAIIGHNGAGKTTLFNILTGLTSPTSGTAHIFGYDVSDSNDMNAIRRMTGVCPQHDILFDNLTPREHLEFFASIKGVRNTSIAVARILKEVDLTEKADIPSKKLSGGQKRKLSIGISIIGDPKILILDEPTAGVDPYSRRHLWSLLQNVRHGRVILLTTHFMDEADILADRKAVVSRGKVRCCGSSFYLKNKFGVGYHLTLVVENGNDNTVNTIRKILNSFVSKTEMARRHGMEVSFILPYNSVENFAAMFKEIENNKQKLGITSYGVSMTTLEEVFLQLQKDDELEEFQTIDNISKKIVSHRTLSRSLSTQTNDIGYSHLKESSPHLGNKNSSWDSTFLEGIKCTPNSTQSLKALLKLRLLRLKREFRKLFFTIFMPIGLTALGLGISNNGGSSNSNIQPSSDTLPSLNLNADWYKEPITVYNSSPSDIGQFEKYLGKGVDQNWNENFSYLLDIAPHLAALDVKILNNVNLSIDLLYNGTLTHSLPRVVNLINNAQFKILDPNAVTIEVSTQPYQFIQNTTDPSDSYTGVNIGSTLILGMVFLFAPVTLAIDMVYDREIKARNQLRVNGLSFTIYFVSFLIVQIAIMTIICTALIILISLFKSSSLSSAPSITILTILVALFCPGSVLFTTCFSYLFDKTETAQSVMTNVSLLLGFLPYLLVMITNVVSSETQTLSRVFHILFSLVDIMYIPYGLIYSLQNIQSNCEADTTCDTSDFTVYFKTEIIIIFIALLIHIPLWYFMVLLVDVKKAGGKLTGVFKKRFTNSDVENSPVPADIGQNEDHDVKMERERVKKLMKSQENPPVVAVQDLHKVFKSGSKRGRRLCRKSNDSANIKIAIKSLSLAVHAGEVFGLLGHNGAGKTTAMKIITAEESPTRGKVQMSGENITSSISSAFVLLGYCPQHDTQWKNITVREHLEVYAAIRGVPPKEIVKIIDIYLNGLKIKEHKDKQAAQCSGGTQRKLSYAMAMVGNPKIVLLDEPSTGMDPESKRFLWDTVLANFRGSKGAILTTHSMEEADALCSRVGIMVNGELRCIGSTQHLKNLYGAGYNLEIKLSVNNHNISNTNNFEECKKFVLTEFPNSVLEESFADRLIYSVPQTSVKSLAKCFSSLERAKAEIGIEEYSFSQTTLEQVFLKFALENIEEQ